jgi:hypothetical protein
MHVRKVLTYATIVSLLLLRLLLFVVVEIFNVLYVVHNMNYFLLVRMRQSDWPRSLSERVGFLHPVRSETQLAAVECNCPLWFSRQKPRSETIFKPQNSAQNV